MLTPEEQETLTRVGPGTPMGELLRRYWMPAGASSELAPGRTLRVRLLGEDLVLFRDRAGRAGILGERCPHRGASLAYGIVDEKGLRCPYHGWKFDVAGRCLATPAEPPASPLPNRVRARAGRVEELGGLVFAYLGPEPAPLLPRFDLFVAEGVLRDVGRAAIPCNWLQIMENSVDPHHVEWLHGEYMAHVRTERGEKPPERYRRRHVEVGFDLFEFGIVKRRVLEGGGREDDDWRIGHPLVFPIMLRVGSHLQHRFQIRVPVDDENTMHYWYSVYHPPAGAAAPAQDEVPVYEVEWRDERGEFRLDTIDGQDVMTWVTQGRIADRTRETLGASDRGVVLLRRLLFDQIRKVAAGEDPLGTIRDPAKNRVIELPQEREKYADGAAFLAESLMLGHSRFSPIRDRILALYGR